MFLQATREIWEENNHLELLKVLVLTVSPDCVATAGLTLTDVSQQALSWQPWQHLHRCGHTFWDRDLDLETGVRAFELFLKFAITILMSNVSLELKNAPNCAVECCYPKVLNLEIGENKSGLLEHHILKDAMFVLVCPLTSPIVNNLPVCVTQWTLYHKPPTLLLENLTRD